MMEVGGGGEEEATSASEGEEGAPSTASSSAGAGEEDSEVEEDDDELAKLPVGDFGVCWFMCLLGEEGVCCHRSDLPIHTHTKQTKLVPAKSAWMLFSMDMRPVVKREQPSTWCFFVH